MIDNSKHTKICWPVEIHRRDPSKDTFAFNDDKLEELIAREGADRLEMLAKIHDMVAYASDRLLLLRLGIEEIKLKHGWLRVDCDMVVYWVRDEDHNPDDWINSFEKPPVNQINLSFEEWKALRAERAASRPKKKTKKRVHYGNNLKWPRRDDYGSH